MASKSWSASALRNVSTMVALSVAASAGVCSVMGSDPMLLTHGATGWLWQGDAMRVAVVAGPDPGHAFPAIALCLRFSAAGDEPTLLTGRQWLDTARRAGI